MYNIIDEIIVNSIDHIQRTLNIKGKNKCDIIKLNFDKLILEIFHMNNNYYISKNFIHLLTYEKSCFMELYRHIDENLFSLPRRDLVKQNKINDSISINYNGFNIELWNINELNNPLNKDFKLNINLIKLINLNNYDIKIK